MWIRVCRYKNAGVAGYAEAFRSVQSDSPTSNWYSYFENNVLVIYHLIERNILYMNTPNNRNDFYKEQLDKTLNGNEKIETAIAALQKEATEEMLAHTLTVIRHRMQEQAQLIIAVEPPKGDGKISLHAIKTNDGRQWWAAFTSFDEELKGSDKIMSTFTADIDKIFASALKEPSVEGVILNPWNRTLMLNKTLINIILGNPV